MNDQAWQAPPPPPPPPYSPPPPRPSPPPYFGPPRTPGQPRPKLRRSRSDRRIGGVAGGLGQYLGVDSTVLRIGFVIASLVFLGGFGGPILYIIAWVLVPEEGKGSPVNRATFSGRPWQDWDRSARSWALVLGALALALIWSFGVWPWFHWRVLPFWLAIVGVGLWLLARHRETGWASGRSPWDRPAAPGSTPGSGPAPGAAPDRASGRGVAMDRLRPDRTVQARSRLTRAHLHRAPHLALRQTQPLLGPRSPLPLTNRGRAGG